MKKQLPLPKFSAGGFPGLENAKPRDFQEVLKEQQAEELAQGQKNRDKDGNPVKVIFSQFDV